MMTAQQVRDLPIGGKVWYAYVKMCKAPGIKLYVNDRPRVITKVAESNLYHLPGCRFAGMPRNCSYASYQCNSKHFFLDEKSAVEYYCAEIQKATKEIAKRKREYCKNANAYSKKIQDDAIKQMNDFLNRGGADAD